MSLVYQGSKFFFQSIFVRWFEKQFCQFPVRLVADVL